MNMLKAIVGLVLVFVYHVPRLVYLLLLASYASVFNNPHNLTANPEEHIKRAFRLLRRGRNSDLLYAALELRFALERMVGHELLLSEAASRRMVKEYDPEKKIRNIRRVDPNSEFHHEIYFVNSETNEKVKWGEYRPLNTTRVTSIKGRLGDLLHPKPGLNLGIADDPWYSETRDFLNETAEYLSEMYRGNTPFFTFVGIDQVEMIRVEEAP